MSDLFYEEDLAFHRALVRAMEQGEPEWPMFFTFYIEPIVLTWGEYRSYVVLPQGDQDAH